MRDNAQVPVEPAYRELPPDVLRFGLRMALRNAFKIIRGLRRQISEIDEGVIVNKVLEES
jgi:hypothetical protein